MLEFLLTIICLWIVINGLINILFLDEYGEWCPTGFVLLLMMPFLIPILIWKGIKAFFNFWKEINQERRRLEKEKRAQLPPPPELTRLGNILVIVGLIGFLGSIVVYWLDRFLFDGEVLNPTVTASVMLGSLSLLIIGSTRNKGARDN